MFLLLDHKIHFMHSTPAFLQFKKFAVQICTARNLTCLNFSGTAERKKPMNIAIKVEDGNAVNSAYQRCIYEKRIFYFEPPEMTKTKLCRTKILPEN